MFESILIVGCGNMAGAMLEGWLAHGVSPSVFTIVDPLRQDAPGGIPVSRDLPASGHFDAILLGVKPQVLDEVVEQLAPLAGEGTMVMSMLAGVQLESLQARFPDARGCVRVMPNLAVSLGKAPIGLAAQGLDEDTRGALLDFYLPLGTPEWVGEDSFDLVTALVGSGPAFVYRFIDALGAAATRLGLPEDEARRLALSMVEGAADLASQCGRVDQVLAGHFIIDAKRIPAHPPVGLPLQFAGATSDRDFDALTVRFFVNDGALLHVALQDRHLQDVAGLW